MPSAILILSNIRDISHPQVQSWYDQWDILEVIEAETDELGFSHNVMDAILLHCQARDFRALLFPSFEALGFSKFMSAQIVERVIKAKAKIHTLYEQINKDNYQTWLARDYPTLDSLKDHRGRWHKVHFELRIRRGLQANRIVPRSHNVILDDEGKEIALELNPKTQQVWVDLAALMLAGKTWKDIAHEMYERFGDMNPEGQPYPPAYYHHLVYTPVFWGNSAHNFKSNKHGAWAYRKGAELPEGVVVHYDTHSPVWSGEQADKIKDNLDNRAGFDHNERLPSEILDGLLICAECGNPLRMYVDGMWLVWRCKTHSRDASPVLRDRYTFKYLKKRISEFLSQNNLQALLPTEKADVEILNNGIEHTQQQLQTIPLTLETLYQYLTNVQSTVIEYAYMEMIILTELRQNRLKQQLQNLERQRTLAQITLMLDKGVYDPKELLQESYDGFWRLHPKTINKSLLQLLNEQKFVVLNGEIIGVSR